MIIQHNINAMNANRQLGITQGSLSKSTEKLSSGYKINRAGDNAAGLAISEKMRGQIRGLSQASTNAEDGISLVQTAEGALQETQNILQRMRELAVQAGNDTNTDDDRTQIQKEITQLTNEVDRIATTSEFNTKKLLDGSQRGAGDNAAGLAISEKMRGQIRGLSQASTNAEDGISLVQTAEGALQETQNILQRMRELAVQAGNDTNTDDDRTQIQKEITQLTNEVDRIATTSEFNTKKLLDGSQRGAVTAQDGNGSTEGTFANGMVSVGNIKTSDAKLVAVNDVIRITLQADCTDSGATMDLSRANVASACVGGTEGPWATIESLNGTVDTNAVHIVEGSITIDTVLADKNDIAGTYPKISDALAGVPSAGPNNLVISFAGIDKLKAGDVITIALQSCTAADPTIGDKSSLRLQVGANAGQEINLSINSMKAKDLGIVKTSGSVSAGATDGMTVKGQALDVTTQSKASLAIEAYDQALQKVSTERAKLGAVQNRLEHTIANLDTSEENLQSAESRIRDTDMADEMTKFSKDNILQQAGTSMLAQANQANQTVLSLLQ